MSRTLTPDYYMFFAWSEHIMSLSACFYELEWVGMTDLILFLPYTAALLPYFTWNSDWIFCHLELEIYIFIRKDSHLTEQSVSLVLKCSNITAKGSCHIVWHISCFLFSLQKQQRKQLPFSNIYLLLLFMLYVCLFTQLVLWKIIVQKVIINQFSDNRIRTFNKTNTKHNSEHIIIIII